MDPISIIGTAVGLAFACVQTAAAIRSAVSRFNEQAHETLHSIYDAVAPVPGALEELEKSMCSHHDVSGEPSLQERILDTVASCKSTLELLQHEMDQLLAVGDNRFRIRLRHRGREGKIDQLLVRLQHNKHNISLLLQTFTARTVMELQSSITPTLERSADSVGFSQTQALHHPSGCRDTCILPCHAESPDYSLLVSNPNSKASSPEPIEFDFDPEVMESRAYRRSSANGRTKRKRNADDISIHVDDDAARQADDEVALEHEQLDHGVLREGERQGRGADGQAHTHQMRKRPKVGTMDGDMQVCERPDVDNVFSGWAGEKAGARFSFDVAAQRPQQFDKLEEWADSPRTLPR